jgi:crossover junction endodeoxyribonuclease RusA
MARSLELELPWPPSVNHYWVSWVLKRRVVVTIGDAGKAYRAAVRACFTSRPETMTCRVSVHIDAYPPDRRTRDLDNIGKAVFDALTYCAVLSDDSQIDEITIRRKAVVPGGRLSIQIVEIQGAPSLF